jgi:hypothetical protein
MSRPIVIVVQPMSAELFAIYVGEPTTIRHYDDPRMAKIFLNSDKGAAIDDAAGDSAVMASTAPRHEVDAGTLRSALTCDRSGVASGPPGLLLDLLAGKRP